jgi:di/tricarboxylate transporter
MSETVPLELHAVAAMAITAGALILFTRERLRLEYSCLAVLLVLVVVFELFPFEPTAVLDQPRPDISETPRKPSATPSDALPGTDPELVSETASDFALRGSDFLLGFGNRALITICLLLMVAKGVEVSGALRPFGRLLVRVWLRNRGFAMLFTLAVTALLSAFVNNTPIVVMLMPILIGVAHRIGMAPSRVLMPFCFATTIGGMTTTIGSSTNLLVVNVAADLGVASIGMFDFIVPASLAAFAGILYLWAVAPRWLPDRSSPLAGTAPRIFYAVIDIDDDSRFAGQTLGDAMRMMEGRTRIERLQRGGLELVRLPSLTLRAGDKLHVRGTPEAIQQLQDSAGRVFDAGSLHRGPDQRLVEIVVTQTSPLHGRRLSELSQTTLGSLSPVGIQKPGPELMKPIEEAGDPMLHVGDLLLMQGHAHDIRQLQAAHNVLILDRTVHLPRTAKAPLATVILVAMILAAAFGVLPIVVSALCATTLMLVTRCLHWDEAWAAIDTRLALVIVTSLALGTALAGTGATQYIAQSFVAVVHGLPPAVALSAFLLMIALLNEIVSNNAVAVIGTPIAVGIAEQLGAPALPFVLAVLFGANAGYVTPIGYQTNLLVYTAGGYKFSDFFRVGAPLQILTWLVLSLALSMIYL